MAGITLYWIDFYTGFIFIPDCKTHGTVHTTARPLIIPPPSLPFLSKHAQITVNSCHIRTNAFLKVLSRVSKITVHCRGSIKTYHNFIKRIVVVKKYLFLFLNSRETFAHQRITVSQRIRSP